MFIVFYTCHVLGHPLLASLVGIVKFFLGQILQEPSEVTHGPKRIPKVQWPSEGVPANAQRGDNVGVVFGCGWLKNRDLTDGTSVNFWVFKFPYVDSERLLASTSTK